MKKTARASAITSPAVVEFARRIQRKRGSLSNSPLTVSVAPAKTGRSFLHALGLGKADIAVGPEITLAKMLKEWRDLDATYMSMDFYRGGTRTPQERQEDSIKDLNSRIALIEYRVFGNNIGGKYPTFERAEQWLNWRLILAHPDYGCDKDFNGWTQELFAFAFEDSKLAFGISLFN